MQDFITNSTPVNLIIIGTFIIIALILILKAVKELSSKSKGKEDSTHAIIAQERTDEKTGEKTEYFVQLEKKEDSNARLFQLGFTVKEVESLIK